MTLENDFEQPNSPDDARDQPFSGNIPAREAIEILRRRLLDLSARNTLINYRHPKRRCIQICGKADIGAVYRALYTQGKVEALRPVPEPGLMARGSKQLDAKSHAELIGMSTSVEFLVQIDVNASSRSTRMQTLLFPTELERQARRITAEARTAIEETGTNMLFLILGFLEFYESDESDRPLVSPLLSLPVSLERGEADPDTSIYNYNLAHNGEDLAQNQTLQEKLTRDFSLNLPDFDPDGEPEQYFSEIERIIRTRYRWRIRRQLTVGMLSFGKLAIWRDLDVSRNPTLLDNGLIKLIFAGYNDGDETPFVAEDYRIDGRPEVNQQLICDADSSQHSAIIDVMAGKNLVINGPPGTGKSQTITNIIGAALAEGKSVLFVSEKLAALEVVRHRLNNAGLGDFCLELHSHKTQKRRIFTEIQDSLDHRELPPAQYDAKLARLKRQRESLARYAEIINSQFGNALGITTNEVFWSVERLRSELGEYAKALARIRFVEAADWSQTDIQERMHALDQLAVNFAQIGNYSEQNAWWGFWPELLVPGDSEAIRELVDVALAAAETADTAASDAVARFNLSCQPDADTALKVLELLNMLPEFPQNSDASRLSTMFDYNMDQKGMRSGELLARLTDRIQSARRLSATASLFLKQGPRSPYDDVATMACRAVMQMSPTLLSANVVGAEEMLNHLEMAINSFCEALRAAGVEGPCGTLAKARILVGELPAFLRLDALAVPIERFKQRINKISEVAANLSSALSRINTITSKRKLDFDSSPQSVLILAEPSKIDGLLHELRIDDDSLEAARKLATSRFAERPICELEDIRYRLGEIKLRYEHSIAHMVDTFSALGIPFIPSLSGIETASSLAQLASDAPIRLLDFRNSRYGSYHASDMIDNLRGQLESEQERRKALGERFHLDVLPSPDELRSSIVHLRRKSGWFAFVDSEWRASRKLHEGLVRTRTKADSGARALELIDLVEWLTLRDAIASNAEYAETFGKLFKGTDTDVEALSRLNSWRQAAQSLSLRSNLNAERFDISLSSSTTITELASKSESVQACAKSLLDSPSVVEDLLGENCRGYRAALTQDWQEALRWLSDTCIELDSLVAFFSLRAVASLSPKDALRHMEAHADLTASLPDINLLVQGESLLKEAAGQEAAQLVAHECTRWVERLSSINQDTILASAFVEKALSFAVPTSTFRDAFRVAESRVALDASWGEVAREAIDEVHLDADGCAPCLLGISKEARSIVRLLSSVSLPGKSIQDLFEAHATEAASVAIISDLSSDQELQNLLASDYRGLETDDARLIDLHEWGRAVVSSGLPAGVQRAILTDAAQEAIDESKRLYEDVAVWTRRAHDCIHRLAGYGSFSWDEWQGHASKYDNPDSPRKIRDRIQVARESSDTVLAWYQYITTRRRCCELGLEKMVNALEDGIVVPTVLSKAFKYCSLYSVGRGICQAHPELNNFNGTNHDMLREDFMRLDAEITSLAGETIAHKLRSNRRVPKGNRGTRVGELTEWELLRHELAKQRRHIPIRQLMLRAGRTLQALRPCFMMGPLSVAQYLKPGAILFDIVVMDEASQLRPEDAIGATARGSQLVVVGDRNQLPPTSFFRAFESEEDDEDDDTPIATSGMESILDIGEQLFAPVRTLKWHYRSQHESLIAFSNHEFYNDRLILFPSPFTASPNLGVKSRYVRDGVYKDRRNVPEAQSVVDAATEHMIRRPDESLGVVTLNITQRDVIDELLSNKLKTFSEGEDYITKWQEKGQPFFIKNLENVQGDERDVIFISTTFGKAPGTSVVRQNFGPINGQHGWRRLNVLFTRAKRKVVLFTSMLPSDIVVDEKSPRGTKALRGYLEYARSGTLAMPSQSDREPDSDFEVAVADAISRMGYAVQPQVGVAGFFIDMAVRDPDRSGEYLAGIECDGATYHSAKSVRDRDRIRQEVLESMGWEGRIYRIWSTDWFYQPYREIAKLSDFLAERRARNVAARASETPEELDEGPVILHQDAPLQDQFELADNLSAPTRSEDLFAEVGDRVTYCYVDEPDERIEVLIVDGPSDPDKGIINDSTPVAVAVLGLVLGETRKISVAGRADCEIRLIKIHPREN